MENVVNQFDDLVAVNRTFGILSDSASAQLRGEVEAIRKRLRASLRESLRALAEEDRETAAYDLSIDYGENVRAELQALIA